MILDFNIIMDISWFVPLYDFPEFEHGKSWDKFANNTAEPGHGSTANGTPM